MVDAAGPSCLDRERALGRLAAEEFDVLVVGGGITGCGVALDAAGRGLRVALVERHDLASGTSSESSKLVHGGLRYLQQHDYHLVYEALAERQHLLRNASHLVHPLPFLIPLFGRNGVVSRSVAQAYSVALWLYDLTGGLRIGRRHRRVSAAEARRHVPGLRADRLVASFLYWDAQADDARLTLCLARTAALFGAVIANYTTVEGLTYDPGGHRVAGARVTADGPRPGDAPANLTIRARCVVNAGGVWAEQIARLDRDGAPVSIRPAKGIHVTVPAGRLPCDAAVVLNVPSDRRSIFVVPWDAATAPPAATQGDPGVGAARYTYLGTTDTDYHGPLDQPDCTDEDIGYVLSAVNAWTTSELTPEDVTGRWVGLRPLVSDAHSARTADLSRRHQVYVSASGTVTVTGGKLTTYRKMAVDTVDAVVKVLRQRADPSDGFARSATRRLALVGAPNSGHRAAPSAIPPPGGYATRLGVGAPTWAHLWGRYGTEADSVIALASEERALLDPLSAALPYLGVEVVWAVRYEMARTVDDVLSRRTRASILNRAAAIKAAPTVACLMGNELGWTDRDVGAAVAAFVAASGADRAGNR